MAAAHEEWKVLGHGAIEHLDDNLWRVEGQLENMPLLRVMTLVRLADGRLVIHNAIALGQEDMDKIEAWGEPAFLVVPNGYHRLDAPAFKRRYPTLKVVCPRAARDKVSRVVAVDLDYSEFPGDASVRMEHFDGCGEAEGLMIVRSGSGTTVVVNDAIFNMPHQRGLQGFVLRHVTKSTGGPTVSRIARWIVIKDAPAFRAHLERLADLPDLRRVIVSHHEVIDADVSRTLRRIAATM
jgi:hypothetical protein